jgi:hypothetical protein
VSNPSTNRIEGNGVTHYGAMNTVKKSLWLFNDTISTVNWETGQCSSYSDCAKGQTGLGLNPGIRNFYGPTKLPIQSIPVLFLEDSGAGPS